MNTITLLVVTYLNIMTGNVTVEKHVMKSMKECVTMGKAISANTKVGKVSTVCWTFNNIKEN